MCRYAANSSTRTRVLACVQACVQVWLICVDLCSVQVIVLACVLVVTTSVLLTFVVTTMGKRLFTFTTTLV